MARLSARWTTVLAVFVAAVVAGPASASTSSTVGAPGGGDPYFPLQGNGGYDARHYAISLRYQPRTGRLDGTVRLRAVAHQRLSRFDLDLRHDMTATRVLVNGVRAAHTQPARWLHELVITPARALPAGRVFTVSVSYGGTARSITDPGGEPDGWIRTPDGAFVAGEPQGSPTWFPVNNTPTDKATYAVRISVPTGWVAVSNGRMFAPVRSAGRTVWRYALGRPVSDYLITATVGRFDIHRGRTASGLPYTVFVDPTQRSGAGLVLRTLPKIIGFFSSRYGPYPFAQAGAIVDNADVGYALETATRPLFPAAPDQLTLAHELAHQWYGDTVTCRRWRDIWVNEGFAEFSDWMWDQHRGGTTMRQHLQQVLARPSGDPTWNPPPGNPGNNRQIFADSVYLRGAATLEALRERLGNPLFFTIMRGWLAAHRWGNATTAGFTRYASTVSHRDLRRFFYVWLYRHAKP